MRDHRDPGESHSLECSSRTARYSGRCGLRESLSLSGVRKSTSNDNRHSFFFFGFGQIIASFVLEILQITVTADGNPSTGTTGNNNNNTASGNANSKTTTTKNNGGKKTGDATGNTTDTNANGGNTASGNNTTTKDNGGKNTTDSTTGNTTATNNKGGGSKLVALNAGKSTKTARNSPAASPSQSSSSNKFQLSYRKE